MKSSNNTQTRCELVARCPGVVLPALQGVCHLQVQCLLLGTVWPAANCHLFLLPHCFLDLSRHIRCYSSHVLPNVCMLCSLCVSTVNCDRQYSGLGRKFWDPNTMCAHLDTRSIAGVWMQGLPWIRQVSCWLAIPVAKSASTTEASGAAETSEAAGCRNSGKVGELQENSHLFMSKSNTS